MEEFVKIKMIRDLCYRTKFCDNFYRGKEYKVSNDVAKKFIDLKFSEVVVEDKKMMGRFENKSISGSSNISNGFFTKVINKDSIANNSKEELAEGNNKVENQEVDGDLSSDVNEDSDLISEEVSGKVKKVKKVKKVNKVKNSDKDNK